MRERCGGGAFQVSLLNYWHLVATANGAYDDEFRKLAMEMNLKIHELMGLVCA